MKKINKIKASPSFAAPHPVFTLLTITRPHVPAHIEGLTLLPEFTVGTMAGYKPSSMSRTKQQNQALPLVPSSPDGGWGAHLQEGVQVPGTGLILSADRGTRMWSQWGQSHRPAPRRSECGEES